MEGIEHQTTKEELTFNDEQLQTIADEYNIPGLSFVEAPQHGIITNNAVLEASDGTRYFAKAYPKEQMEKLAGTYRVAELAATNSDIPVALPLTPVDGSYTTTVAGCSLALFPFEDGSSTFPESREDNIQLTKNMSVLLGKIHAIPVPEDDELLQPIPRWQYEARQERLKMLERVIKWAESAEEQTEFDVLAAKSARAKLELVKTLPEPDPTLLTKGLCHADYHPGNVAYTPDMEVTAIFDWDNAGVADPYIDFLNVVITKMKQEQELEETIQSGLLPEIISSYQEGLGRDIDIDALKNAFAMLLHERVSTPWPLFQHYQEGYTQNDERAEILYHRAHFLAENYERIWGLIEEAVEKKGIKENGISPLF